MSIAIKKPGLIFAAHYDRDPGLDSGRLVLFDYYYGWLQVWVCVSSVTSRQGKENFHNWGSMLPPTYRTKNARKYEVMTQPVDLSHNKGVRGNFYKILPHQIVTDKGGKRSDFGIHLDANVPGSLGCPVMTKERFAEFEKWMKKLAKLGFIKIPMQTIIS